MKIKDGYSLRNVGGDFVVVPMDANIQFNKMMTLNETGGFLWNALEKGAEIADLVSALTAEYDVDAATAEKSANKFVAKLKELDLVE